MSYFEDVYLVRAKKHGNTRQEIRKSRAVNEFERIFLKRTMYYCTIADVNDEELDLAIEGSLQVSKRDETKQIYNLLTKLDDTFNLGDQLKIEQRIGDVYFEKIWLVLFKEEDISKGYNKYKLICLDSVININDRYGVLIKEHPIKILTTNSRFFDDYFELSKVLYREPDSQFVFVTKDNSNLKKELYFELSSLGYEISFINRIAINGAAFCSCVEKLKKLPEPSINKEAIETPSNTNFFLNNLGGN